MTQKDKSRESFSALISIKSTADNIIDYCSEYSSEAADYAQETKHKCEETGDMDYIAMTVDNFNKALEGNNQYQTGYNLKEK